MKDSIGTFFAGLIVGLLAAVLSAAKSCETGKDTGKRIIRNEAVIRNYGKWVPKNVSNTDEIEFEWFLKGAKSE
jgi:hypothetical protein